VNLSHRSALGVDEAATGVLHEVPAVDDLDRLRQGMDDALTIAIATVAGEALDRGTLFQLSLSGRLLAVQQKRNDAASFESADKGAVAGVASPSEIVDAADVERIARCRHPSADDVQQRVSVDWQHEALGEARTGATTKCKLNVMNDLLQP